MNDRKDVAEFLIKKTPNIDTDPRYGRCVTVDLSWVCIERTSWICVFWYCVVVLPHPTTPSIYDEDNGL